jgi:hypothetical protein
MSWFDQRAKIAVVINLMSYLFWAFCAFLVTKYFIGEPVAGTNVFLAIWVAIGSGIVTGEYRNFHEDFASIKPRHYLMAVLILPFVPILKLVSWIRNAYQVKS